MQYERLDESAGRGAGEDVNEAQDKAVYQCGSESAAAGFLHRLPKIYASPPCRSINLNCFYLGFYLLHLTIITLFKTLFYT